MTNRFCHPAGFSLRKFGSSFSKVWLSGVLFLISGLTSDLGHCQISLSPSADMLLDSNALIFPDTANFSRYPNGSSYRTEPFLTFGDYQFAAWYHAGPGTGEAAEENIYIARRRLTGNTWDIRDTGQQMINGDTPGNEDSHNVISMGISGDGRIHLAYDMHAAGQSFRYLSSQAGRATTSDANWNNTSFTVFNAERDSLNLNGTSLSNATYPRFINNGDDMYLTYRQGGSGNGDTIFARYDADGSPVHSRWVDVNGNGGPDVTQTIIDGSVGNYNGPFPSPSSGAPGDDHLNSPDRNAYLNGMDVDPTGRIHTTWTWREDSKGANHDINYAYSDDGGATWNNNDGVNLGSTISINSPGIIVESLDLRQALANQQGQAVDNEGGVHALMYHRDPNKPWTPGEGNFFGGDSEYYHYYRDPLVGEWTRSSLPLDGTVGSRPSIGFDRDNNLYAAYLTRVPNSNGPEVLRIAGAEKLPSGGYAAWEVLEEDNRDWSGTPFLDQTRLLNDDVLSIYVQEDTTSTERAGTNLRVLEFNVLGISAIPEPGSLTVLMVLSLSLIGRRPARVTVG
jgi:hypothetical protein